MINEIVKFFRAVVRYAKTHVRCNVIYAELWSIGEVVRYTEVYVRYDVLISADVRLLGTLIHTLGVML